MQGHSPLSFPSSSCTKIVCMYKFLLTAVATVTCMTAAYCILCIIAAAQYISRRARPVSISHSMPPISILKPLKGTDPEMYESLRSHCTQDYPEYEILFGISDPGDPSAEIVKSLQKEFPDRITHLVHCGKNLGANFTRATHVREMPK